MTPVLRLGLKFGWASGASSGALVGAIAAIVGSLISGSRPDLISFVAGTFLLMLIVLPLFYYLNVMANPDTVADRPLVIDNSYAVSVFAWLIGLLVGGVSFMIPVLMVPLLMNKFGISFATSSAWFRDVELELLGWRGLLVAVVSLVGFGVVAHTIRVPVKTG